MTPIERKALDALLELAGAAYHMLDDCETTTITDEFDGEPRTMTISTITQHGLAETSAALDKLDELPDDQPGYTMGPAAKAAWALREIMK